MATRIVFDTGLEVVAAEAEADVVVAVRRDHPNPVTLEGPTGQAMHVNWEHVAFIEELIATPSSSD